jgi:Protein of unknown function with HXXEE motif
VRSTIAASPLVFLTHDLEEALGAERMNELLGRPLAGRLGELVPGGAPTWLRDASEVSRDEMLIAAGLVFAASAAVAWPLAARPRRGPLATLVATAASLRLANSLMHAAHAGSARHYVPGLATSLGVGLPYSLALLHDLRKGNLVSDRGLFGAALAGVLLLPPAALATRLAARRIAVSRGSTPAP